MFTKILAASLLVSTFGACLAHADADRNFRRGRFNGPRGNEGSQRPGRFQPGELRHGGNGCPAGTMRVAFAPDNLSFTILFDKFVADANSNDNGARGRMSCDATLSIDLPDNQQMEITRVDYRGFVSIPQGGRGMLTSMFNFVEDDRGPGFGRGGRHGWRNRDRINLRFAFDQAITENYEISTGTMNEGRGLLQTEVSPCGGEAQLRIVNTVQVMAPQGQPALLTVDSIDGASNSVYYVNWRACQTSVQPPPPPRCGPQGCRPAPFPPQMCGRFPCPPRR